MTEQYKENLGGLTLEGSVENIIYRNDQNGYTVFDIIPSAGAAPANDKPEASEITCTAFLTDINAGEHVRLTGNFIVHPSYGRQFNVASMVRSDPTSISGIVKYLASSVKGIGERTAIRIAEAFGLDTFTVIEHFPERLAALNGISSKKAQDISQQFKEQSSLRHTMMYLQGFGISPALIQKIYKRYKEDSIEVVKKNPYLLAEDIYGVGFKTADAIAHKAGIDPSSEFRVKAGVKYVLNEGAQNGHVFLERGLLCDKAAELMEIPRELAEDCLLTLQFEKQILQDSLEGITAVYLNKYFYSESFVAKKLLELRNAAPNIGGNAPAFIDAHEKALGITLADNQRLAVAEALSSGVLVVTGGPGTGKTTVINAILGVFKKQGLTVELAAPTGRAAKRVEEATGSEAKTIHRLLGMAGGDEASPHKIEKNEENPIKADVVIIDESSMVDIMLMYCLLKAIPAGTRLILAGDADQLPSVGPGNVLKDVINSGEINIVKLTHIFRQSAESAIVMNAHRINNGVNPVFNEKGRGFYIVRRDKPEDIHAAVTSLVRDRLPGYAGADPMTDIQVLTPMRKGILGAQNLNRTLQEALNPPGKGRREREMGGFIFREGDKVMQIKNNYNLVWRVFDRGRSTEGAGVYNGDEGVIDVIDEERELLRVRFDGGRLADYSFDRLDELELAYAVTIHKSQGSEYKAVVMPVFNGPPALMTRNLLYTAVTRAKELAVMVGMPHTLRRMVENNREIQRYSALSYRLRKISGFMSEQEAF